MKISANSKVVLTFSFMCFVVWLISCFVPDFTTRFFVVKPTMSFSNPLDYFRLVSHVLGHANWAHLYSNLILILLLGLILEEKYGHWRIFLVILLTALLTGIINVMFFSKALHGASGVVFAFIILVSIVGKEGTIPLEFLIIVPIFIGGEIVKAFSPDSVSQMTHVLGGISGAIFGFAVRKGTNNQFYDKDREEAHQGE